MKKERMDAPLFSACPLRIRGDVVSVLLQQLLQLAMEQLLLSDVQLDHPLEVSGAVDVDVVAVKPQLLAGFVGQLDLHLDLDVAAPEHEADFVLLVLAGDPILGSEQQGSLRETSTSWVRHWCSPWVSLAAVK
jgi:hypothetical protein